MSDTRRTLWNFVVAGLSFGASIINTMAVAAVAVRKQPAADAFPHALLAVGMLFIGAEWWHRARTALTPPPP